MTDALEALTNAATGLIVSVVFIMAMGWEDAPGAALGASAAFFTLSTARSYAVRRLFRWLEGRHG